MSGFIAIAGAQWRTTVFNSGNGARVSVAGGHSEHACAGALVLPVLWF